MDGIIYRPVAMNDLDALAALYTRYWCQSVLALEDKMLAGRMCLLIQLVRSQHALVAEQDGAVVGVCLGSRIVDGAIPEVGMWCDLLDRTWAEAVERAKTADEELEDSLFCDWRELQKADAFIAGGSPYAEAQITLFMVDPQVKGQGVGGVLYTRVRELLRESGARRFFLMTDTQSDFAYYEHRGMKRLASYPTDPDDSDSWAFFIYGGEL